MKRVSQKKKTIFKRCEGCEGGNCRCLSLGGLVGALVVAAVIVAGLVVVARRQRGTEEKTGGCIQKELVEAAVEQGKCYVIYDNKIFDMSSAKKWDLTGHVGKHLCGKTYDKETIEKGPHPATVMDKFYLADVCQE